MPFWKRAMFWRIVGLYLIIVYGIMRIEVQDRAFPLYFLLIPALGVVCLFVSNRFK